MKILLTPFNWMQQAGGGEWYLYRLSQHFMRLGHEIKCICYCETPYTHDGIECYPQGDMQLCFANNNDLFEWADIVIHQLMGNSFSYNKCRQHNKPNIFIAHNFAKHYFLTDKSQVVYNSHYMASLNLFNASGTVLQPLVDYRDYKPSTGNKIALINCNENKGGRQFIELAKMLPQYEFVGYEGMYGEQIKGDNITYYRNGAINWDEIKILLCPSVIESWSQVATEAMCNGIPVICSDLPGLRENLSYAGIYIDRDRLDLYADAIINMDYDKQRALSLQRAKELDPLPRVDKFNEWLCSII